jgi:CheY-like chemotaxis protein
MTSQQEGRPIEILLVEDNPADARLAQDTIQQSDQPANITQAEDGEEAMAILRREGEHSGAARPDLILLDLRMPKKDGMQVLADLSQDEGLYNIPVMLLTGTEAEANLLATYSIPASRYARKPLQLEQFTRVLGQLDLFSSQPIQVPGTATATATSPPRTTGEPAGKRRRWWWPFG